MSPTITPYEDLRLLNQPFENQFKQKLNSFLEEGWYILGKEVALFEKEFGEYHNEKYVVGVANGLDALILSLKCCNFEKGREVIVPSNTYIATILAILHCNLIPVLVEPNIHTYNIDPEKIDAAITIHTVAIMVVHLYGQCCDMAAIQSIAEKYKIKIVEDCAQAHGATYKGKLAGTFGDFAAFSFYPTKNLGALGDAGAIICKSDTDYEVLRQLRNYGSGQKYHNSLIGYNSRLDEIQASFLRVKLPYLNQINEHKNKLALIYLEHLNDVFIKPLVKPNYYNVYHIFNIRHPDRDKIRAYLLENGITTEIHYPIAPHKQTALKAMNHLNFPISSEIHQTTLSLPCSYIHSVEDVHNVIKILNKFN
ncbi:DegT/DnrJ/EryC1/StrS family aminotransferase [Mucilaginibacter sp. UYCu711]|uniref:DegT/DnrJ/EryC1/StrS family aminotransferase n=1 Tax=Mucilaginibacter sp. UYCu711 TaxID=3156339 RepID=UPI003D1F4F3A